jgi:hypothetical protein
MTVAFLFDAGAQVLVKAAEARDIVWMNYDLICFDQFLGIGRVT